VYYEGYQGGKGEGLGYGCLCEEYGRAAQRFVERLSFVASLTGLAVLMDEQKFDCEHHMEFLNWCIVMKLSCSRTFSLNVL
jgi:hypothetical protein